MSSDKLSGSDSLDFSKFSKASPEPESKQQQRPKNNICDFLSSSEEEDDIFDKIHERSKQREEAERLRQQSISNESAQSNNEARFSNVNKGYSNADVANNMHSNSNSNNVYYNDNRMHYNNSNTQLNHNNNECAWASSNSLNQQQHKPVEPKKVLSEKEARRLAIEKAFGPDSDSDEVFSEAFFEKRSKSSNGSTATNSSTKNPLTSNQNVAANSSTPTIPQPTTFVVSSSNSNPPQHQNNSSSNGSSEKEIEENNKKASVLTKELENQLNHKMKDKNESATLTVAEKYQAENTVKKPVTPTVLNTPNIKSVFMDKNDVKEKKHNNYSMNENDSRCSDCSKALGGTTGAVKHSEETQNTRTGASTFSNMAFEHEFITEKLELFKHRFKQELREEFGAKLSSREKDKMKEEAKKEYKKKVKKRMEKILAKNFSVTDKLKEVLGMFMTDGDIKNFEEQGLIGKAKNNTGHVAESQKEEDLIVKNVPNVVHKEDLEKVTIEPEKEIKVEETKQENKETKQESKEFEKPMGYIEKVRAKHAKKMEEMEKNGEIKSEKKEQSSEEFVIKLPDMGENFKDAFNSSPPKTEKPLPKPVMPKPMLTPNKLNQPTKAMPTPNRTIPMPKQMGTPMMMNRQMPPMPPRQMPITPGMKTIISQTPSKKPEPFDMDLLKDPEAHSKKVENPDKDDFDFSNDATDNAQMAKELLGIDETKKEKEVNIVKEMREPEREPCSVLGHAYNLMFKRKKVQEPEPAPALSRNVTYQHKQMEKPTGPPVINKNPYPDTFIKK